VREQRNEGGRRGREPERECEKDHSREREGGWEAGSEKGRTEGGRERARGDGGSELAHGGRCLLSADFTPLPGRRPGRPRRSDPRRLCDLSQESRRRSRALQVRRRRFKLSRVGALRLSESRTRTRSSTRNVPWDQLARLGDPAAAGPIPASRRGIRVARAMARRPRWPGPKQVPFTCNHCTGGPGGHRDVRVVCWVAELRLPASVSEAYHDSDRDSSSKLEGADERGFPPSQGFPPFVHFEPKGGSEGFLLSSILIRSRATW
jgi:hypothetical protein